MANSVSFLSKKEEGVDEGEASSKIAAQIGAFFQNRLDLTAHLVFGLGPNNKVEFSVVGNDTELSKLLYVLLKMAPPTVIRNLMKTEALRAMQSMIDDM